MDAIVGQIQLFPFNFEMEGWMKCEGQTLNMQQYQLLFSLVSYTFGGGGMTFKLPDLKGKSPIPGLTYYIAYDGMYPRRS